MKAVIFCGGSGTRMWPISRKARPKQLEKIFGARSTAQLAFDRIKPILKSQNIFIATSKDYKKIVEESFPQIPEENFFYEPESRDLGPAVGNALFRLEKICPNEPVAILWSDHLIENEELFRKMLETGGRQNLKNPNKIVYFGCRIRFPNVNLGWIKLGGKIGVEDGVEIYNFENWTYRPHLEEAKKWFKEKSHVWNMGYFIATPRFIVAAYEKYAPGLAAALRKSQEASFEEIYPRLEKISFDDAVVVHIPRNEALVLSADIGWSDPGALNALKEALEKKPKENVTKGKVALRKVEDCLVYNEGSGLAAAIGVKGLLIVVTEDVVLVCDKNSVPEIKKMVESFKGTELEKCT